jgi:hypothetical protein
MLSSREDCLWCRLYVELSRQTICKASLDVTGWSHWSRGALERKALCPSAWGSAQEARGPCIRAQLWPLLKYSEPHEMYSNNLNEGRKESMVTRTATHVNFLLFSPPGWGSVKSNCASKAQKTHPLVREDAPHQESRNCHIVKKNLAMGPRWVSDTKILVDWPTDHRS